MLCESASILVLFMRNKINELINVIINSVLHKSLQGQIPRADVLLDVPLEVLLLAEEGLLLRVGGLEREHELGGRRKGDR